MLQERIVQDQDLGTESLHISLLTGFDIDLFKAGKHYRLYDKLGAHVISEPGVQGVYFGVWAPNARHISVIGDFNGWDAGAHPMHQRWDGSGIWELFVSGAGKGAFYKYRVETGSGVFEKSDPFAFFSEQAPATASIVHAADFKWTDKKWIAQRDKEHALSKPISVYELHLGSWKRKDDNTFMTYADLAVELPAYCRYMGFTHVEFMPVMEHPFYGSWGYQITGYFAPTSRYGAPQDFQYLINELHKAGIGVLLDWVPSHFPADEHGLYYFDGTHLYEHEDPRKGFHPDWQSMIFNYGRSEVRSFLISNALYWLDKYHVDGLRVDAVASMLYLDYSRKHGEWEPNEHGGRENLDAVHFLREFNNAVHEHHPGIITIAEESTAWPGVTTGTQQGGLGFDLKWMMGWMHDTLSYFQKDPVYRGYHQGQLAFSIHYAFSEHFMLPLSHDEVVHGKRSMISKMPGDEWQQFANLRLLYSYMYGHPGAKLLFMGGEFAQWHEWRHDYSLDWDNNSGPLHNGLQLLLKALNKLYTSLPAWYQHNFSPDGFEWIDMSDGTNSVLCWIRKGRDEEQLVFVANFTPMPRYNYRIGVSQPGYYREIFNSDDAAFGGSNLHNREELETAPIAQHNRSCSLSLTLPPLGLIILQRTKAYPSVLIA